jgi:hypothetical protein
MGNLVLTPSGSVRKLTDGINRTDSHPDYKAVDTKQPGAATMNRWIDSGIARATDGCKVEPDGVCQHGHPSWILILGYI